MLADWLCFFVPLGGFTVAYMLLYRRALRRLEAWALAQGYDLIRIQRPPLRPGPVALGCILALALLVAGMVGVAAGSATIDARLVALPWRRP